MQLFVFASYYKAHTYKFFIFNDVADYLLMRIIKIILLKDVNCELKIQL